MDGLEGTALKLTRNPVNADFATLHLKTQNIFGPLAGNLMGSGMLSVKHAETTMTLSPFQKPFVWSVTQLTRFFRDPKMVELLTGPGTDKTL